MARLTFVVLVFLAACDGDPCAKVPRTFQECAAACADRGLVLGLFTVVPGETDGDLCFSRRCVCWTEEMKNRWPG